MVWRTVYYYENDYDDDGSPLHSIGEYNSSRQTYNFLPIFFWVIPVLLYSLLGLLQLLKWNKYNNHAVIAW